MTSRTQPETHPRVTFFVRPQPAVATTPDATREKGASRNHVAIYITEQPDNNASLRIWINQREKHVGDYKSIPSALSAAVTTVNTELTNLNYPEQLSLL
jgi:hypothetical protein